MPDFPLALKFADRAELILLGDIRIDAVQLPEIDALEPQAAKTAFQPFAQTVRPAVDRPLSRAGAFEPAFRGDHQSFGIRMERFGDQFFADVRSIRFRCVDEVDAELDGPAEDRDGLVVISRRSPDACAGDAHCSESEAVNG